MRSGLRSTSAGASLPRHALFALAAAVIQLLNAPPASAHRDDYLDETLVYLTLEQGELEAEYWLDFGFRPTPAKDFVRHNVALEWGISDRWMIDSRASIESEDGDGTTLESARVESRYRFLDEGDLPVDIAISGEVNWSREQDGSTTFALEPRVILSRDFGEKLNFTLNLSDEIPLQSGSPAFLAALGVRFNWTQLVRIGSEAQYDIRRHAGSIVPQLWFAFPRDITLKVGYSIGVARNEEDFARAALEVEF